jgi:glucosylceramidase
MRDIRGNLKRVSTVTCLLVLLLWVNFGFTQSLNYCLDSTSQILVTSATGDQLTSQKNVSFQSGQAQENVVKIFPDSLKQAIYGIGTSFTESSAFVLAQLEQKKRQQVMRRIFSKDGANFSLARTHIGACDFSVEGKYSYADTKGDFKLENFSIEPDLQGFSKTKYNTVKDEDYDLLPMIKEALEIKSGQENDRLRIIASAWTAPAWMKDIEEWYIPGAPENNWQGTGGNLKPEYVPTYADYLIKYLQAYQTAGVEIWGITPVNEPHGNNGQWESMHFTPRAQNKFIKNFLGPKLHANGYEGLRLFIYDQNRDGLEEWADLIFTDPETGPYVDGAAIHWYASTFKVFEDVLEKVHKKFPQFELIHTEGCIDDLGKEAPGGISDPDGYQESGWWMNDDFWWHKNATDWAYSANWQGVKKEDHPAYVPVHRYARNIIVSLDSWVGGWIDWNIVLNKKGGPNHVANYCGAPIMIDTQNQQVYYTPIFHVLSQFSRTIRPGDVAVATSLRTENLQKDDLHICATLNSQNLLSIQLLNTTSLPITYDLQIGEQFAEIKLTANSVQTVQVQLNETGGQLK